MAGKRQEKLGALLPLALGLGVLLLGWGLDDVPGFFRHPARAGLVAVAVLGAAVLIGLNMDVRPFRRGQRPVGVQRWTLPLIMLAAVFLVGFLSYADRRGVLTFSESWLRYVGLLLYAGGNVLAFLALHVLGRQYSGYVTLQEDHKLVQHGIYGWIRHPIYLRALLVAVGLPLIFRSWLLMPLLVLMAVFVAVRISKEEALLAEQFGAEFDAYRERTWRLFPYLY